jgi:hypothetical protein
MAYRYWTTIDDRWPSVACSPCRELQPTAGFVKEGCARGLQLDTVYTAFGTLQRRLVTQRA